MSGCYNKNETQTGGGVLWELSAGLECVFDQSESLVEAPHRKIINPDHQSSLQAIAMLPGTIKCNMRAIINLKYPI